MKKLIALVLALVCVVGLVGCKPDGATDLIELGEVSAFVSETGDMISAADNVVSGYKNDIQSKKLWERIKAAYFKFEDYYFEMLDDIGK